MDDHNSEIGRQSKRPDRASRLQRQTTGVGIRLLLCRSRCVIVTLSYSITFVAHHSRILDFTINPLLNNIMRVEVEVYGLHSCIVGTSKVLTVNSLDSCLRQARFKTTLTTRG